MGSPLNPKARKVGKRSKMTALELHDAIRHATEENENRVRNGLQQVKIGDSWIDISNTKEVERVIRESQEG